MRLFVALELDETARALLADCQRRLASLDRAVRWVRPEQIHLTLKFLGEVPDARVVPVCEALDALTGLPTFEFEMEGVGTFGSPRSPRVVWVGIRTPNPPLAGLQRACEDRLAALGFPPEGRAFAPHLTLGRVKDPRGGRSVAEAIRGLSSVAVGPLAQQAQEAVLFESILHPQGPQHVPVHRVLLRKS